MKSSLESDQHQRIQCACECGRRNIGETGRPLAVRFIERRRNFKESLLEKLKLAQHATKECYRVIWEGARIWGIESNSR
jgi:hypothetical protein